jgi:predicted outer membrane repeat protein
MLEDRSVPATLTVNTTLDVLGHDNGMLSLRQAVIDANASPNANTIVLPAGTYTLTQAPFNGDLQLSGDLTIKGAGASATVVDGAGLDRVFQVLGGAKVVLTGITIQHGSPFGGLGDGGGIYDAGTLKVNNCTISGNTGFYGGGIANEGGGVLTVNNSTFSNNTAHQFGGSIFVGSPGTVTVTNSTLSGNVADAYGRDGEGGAIFSGSTTIVTVSNSTLANNSAAGFGGAIATAGTVIIRDSTLSGNSCPYGGAIGDGGNVTVSNCILADNSADFQGGGIYNQGTLTVANSGLIGNSAAQGGAIYNLSFSVDTPGSVTIRDSSLVGNSATQGGAIYNDFYNDGAGTTYTGTVTLQDSSLTGNTATDFGGGIANFGTLTIQDSAVLSNTSPLGGDLYNAGVASLFDSIIGDRYDV